MISNKNEEKEQNREAVRQQLIKALSDREAADYFIPMLVGTGMGKIILDMLDGNRGAERFLLIWMAVNGFCTPEIRESLNQSLRRHPDIAEKYYKKEG